MSFSVPNIVLGVIGIGLGVLVTYSAYHINHHILFAGWVEKKWGPGTGTLFYRLFGLVIAIFSILVFLGIVDLYGSAFGSNTPSTQTRTNQGNTLVPRNSGQSGGRIAN
jgi:hypothetical protein